MELSKVIKAFDKAIGDYHEQDRVDAPLSNPFPESTLEHLLYHKCWIDTVQWHLEDMIRDTRIEPGKALEIKRWIDKSNQERTELVEGIDDYLVDAFRDVTPMHDATLNTESPAWAIDRLSILALKIFHMQEQMDREDATPEHIEQCSRKLAILQEQQTELMRSIQELLEDIGMGRKRIKVYRQMKMYNDPSLNPVLYGQRKK